MFDNQAAKQSSGSYSPVMHWKTQESYTGGGCEAVGQTQRLLSVLVCRGCHRGSDFSGESATGESHMVAAVSASEAISNPRGAEEAIMSLTMSTGGNEQPSLVDRKWLP